jgi:hypothetical protein
MSLALSAPRSYDAAWMLVIRGAQWVALDRAAWNLLAADVVQHVGTHLSDQIRALGADRTRAIVERALEGAARRGVKKRGGLFKYCSLAMVFGPELDSIAWVARYLDDPGIESPDERVERLNEEVIARLSDGRL